MLPVRASYNPVLGLLSEPSRLLNGRWSDLFDWALETPSEIGFPVDVHEEGDDLIVEAEVPGLTREDLEITVEENVLTISGEHKTETEEKKPDYHLRERRYGRFSRSFTLPRTADGDKMVAELANGVLTLRIPTREEAKPHKIKVK